MKALLHRWRTCFEQWRALRRRPVEPCDTGSLRSLDGSWILQALPDPNATRAWERWIERSRSIRPPDGTGGVNPGDQRALFTLVCALRPSCVLEIGTHIGASTLSIAAALETLSGERTVTTVDVIDVNDETVEHWSRFGAPCAPDAALESVGLSHRVRFVCEPALSFLDTAAEADLVFLDGDHSAAGVYQEVPAALRILVDNGVLVLHDYFPGLKPLWPDGALVPGPFLAVRRLQREGAGLKVLPFGRLPWPTKCDSTVSSLALLTR